MRILEFKREQNDDFKEKSKLKHLQRALDEQENQDLISLSREVHWFIESKSKDSKLNLRIVPYLDFMSTQGASQEFQSFINALVVEAMQIAPDRSEAFARYLHLVSTCQGSIKGASGGLIVSVDSEGKVNYVVVEDLRELRLTLSQLHALHMQRQIEQQRERTLEHDRKELSLEQGYSR